MPDHIHFALDLDGPARGRRLLTDAEITAALRAPEPGWLHLQSDHPATEPWIAAQLAWLPEPVREALVATETRPNVAAVEDGHVVFLRALNEGQGGDPEDMVSVRLYLDPARIVSLARSSVAVIDGLAKEVEAGTGPVTPGHLLAELVDRLVARIEDHVERFDDHTDVMEEIVITGPDPALRARIADDRRAASLLNRYVSPQRDAVDVLARIQADWVAPRDRQEFVQAHDRMVRTAEVLASIRERQFLIREELTGVMAERLNRNLYLLSLVTVVFLPLGFLTGLMGINIAGMPGMEWPGAFWTFTAGLGGVAIGMIALLTWMNR